jgi:Zn-dependent M28 family amino/carboxypeptidase
MTLPERSRNVYVVFFDEEERGMWGSRSFAQMLREEGKAVVAVHTIDQMGWDADGDGAIELELPHEGAEELYDEAARAVGFTSTIHVTTETGSDHSAFRRMGMPAVGLTEEYRNGDTTPHIHRPSDTWDTVDYEYLARATRLVQAAMGILVGEGT